MKIGYQQIDLEKVRELARSGLTEREIALELEVTQSMFGRWKLIHPEFKDILDTWKSEADKKVERSLYELCVGYEHMEEKIFCSKDGLVTKVPTVKHHKPCIKSIIFWLTNRQSQEWKAKVDVESKDFNEFAKAILEARKNIKEIENSSKSQITAEDLLA